MNFSNLLFGRALRSSAERAEQIGALSGIPIFGLDALSSAAYGPEAALTLLIPLGALGLNYILPITAAIIILLIIVYFSYMQTIPAYPSGGGSYTVARENLGESAGVLAAAALMVDYVLVVAVGISAGVGALVSALPSLQPHTLGLCLGILALITLVNLRGVRETGAIFLLPTYLFVGSLAIAIVIGLVRTFLAHGHPLPVVAPLPLTATRNVVSIWILLQAFASGCTAMTGVEAVSNGVGAFREPKTKNARITLTIIIGILVLLLAGIAYLAQVYHIGAADPGSAKYQSLLSQLLTAMVGRGVFYYAAIASILTVLALSANTAFADFPRLCQIVALHKLLPSSFASRGRRLVFSQGIYVLAVLSAILLIIFGGVTDRLIPLFAIGAFLAFTLSQMGMVVHWKKLGGPGAFHSMLVNGVGAAATLLTVVIVLVAKFTEGAWITVLIIPALMILMIAIHRHYVKIEREICSDTPLYLERVQHPLIIVPIKGWNKATKKALRFAIDLSPTVKALYVEITKGECSELRRQWKKLVVDPSVHAEYSAPELEIAYSPYRKILTTILHVAQRESEKNPDRQIVVVVPELVQNRWYNFFLHNQRASVLKARLYFLGNNHIVVVNVPWYLEEGHQHGPLFAEDTREEWIHES